MKQADFIAAAQANGWRLFHVDRKTGDVHMRCDRRGCPTANVFSARRIQRGDVPKRCDRDHRGEYAGPVIDRYESIVEVLRRRRMMLGLSQDEVEFAAGLTTSHIAKLESGVYTTKLETLIIWANALGYEVTLAPAPVHPAVLRTLEGKVQRKGASGEIA